MLRGKIYITILICLFWLCATVQAETIYHKDNLFNLGMGTRPLALGKAFTAMDGDVNAMMFNPAGLASLKTPTVMGLKAKRFADVDQYTVLGAYTLPDELGVVGLGYLELSLPDILIADPLFDADGYTQVAGKASYGERAYILSYAKRFAQHAVGINLKSYATSFASDVPDITDDVQGNANDIDIGYLYYLNPSWKFGASYRDAIGQMHWSTNTVEKMRAVTRVGTVYSFDWQPHRGNILIDFETAADTPGLAHIGVEDTLWDVFTLRVGGLQRVWASSTKFSLVAGVGIAYAGFHFDYAYYPDVAEENDNKHFFSLGYVFGGEKKPAAKTENRIYAPVNDESDSIQAIDEPLRTSTGRYVEQQYAVLESN